MINWTIKIQSPILTTGMSFQVKYRKLPSTVWVSFSPNPTTNEFTITNLENGDYEAEIRTVCTNGELSNPVYQSNAAGQTCPIVMDLTYTENVVDPSSYMYRSFTFDWTRQIGLMYRLEFQKDGTSAGFNDNAGGINSNVPVTVYGINCDKVRVVTICGNNVESPSEWYDIPAPEQIPCYSYTISCRYGSGEEYSVDYIDCAGNPQSATVRGTDGGQSPNQSFCARYQSVTEGSGQGQLFENGYC